MKVIRLNNVSNFLKLEPQSVDDLYLLAIIISKGDVVEAHTTRRFRPSDGDIGEQKDVVIRIVVERAEMDRSAARLRLSGKIISGKPEEFVAMGSYHTLNIAAQDELDIQKTEWKDYILKRIKQAVLDAKKPRLGVVMLDDEKALVSYIRGYGIDIVAEIFSRLSKRMKEKDYQRRRSEYFDDVITAINNMHVDLVVVAGPGFTKDDIQKHSSDKGFAITKKVVYTAASDADRSGIREVMQSDAVSKLLANEHVKREFGYLNRLLASIRGGVSSYGPEKVADMLESSNVSVVIVNDDIINRDDIRDVLDKADRIGVRIEIFNSDDDAGIQLRNFRGIAAL